jgi:endonuclease-8
MSQASNPVQAREPGLHSDGSADMPEGDTLFNTALRLRPALVGHVMTRFEAPRLIGDRPQLGVEVEAVEARGKNLLVHFADGLSLRTHLRMTGSWHVYREGERWRKAPNLARVVVGTDSGWLGVCFQAPVVETYHRSAGEPSPLRTLGPDLCDESPDLDLAAERMAGFAGPDTQVAESLLDQRVAAGIGNVYKSEALWAAGIDPFTRTADLAVPRRRRLLEIAHRQLRSNLGSGSRVTHPMGLAVYGRRGRPCRRCGSPTQMARQGEQARSTYWCPQCQG